MSTTGVELITQERMRQIEQEGWTAEHDDGHDNYELSSAACCYAQMGAGGPFSHPTPSRPPENWPWQKSWWKPSPDPIVNLVKAGALIAAEIDRLQRKAEDEADGEIALTVTARFLLDNCHWQKACEVLGLNEWSVNEGLMDYSDTVSMTQAQAERIGII